MAKQQEIKNLGVYGVIREAEVDSNLIPDGAVTDVVNFQFDRKGASTVRAGLTTLGGTVSTIVGATTVGLFNAQNSTMAVAMSLGASVIIYRYNGSSWPILTTNMTASTKVRFVDFAGNTLILNGMYDSMRAWNGSTGAVTLSGNPLNPDQFTHDTYVNTQTLRAKFGDVYKSRIYLAGDPTNPSRLFFSSVISGTGNITWTPGTDWVDLNPSDGEDLTGIKRYSLELLCFKPNYTYRFRTSGVDPDPLVKLGTRSQESVVEGKRGVYFHHDTGFYNYTGSYPTEISRPISDIVNAIPYAQYSNIVGWNDADHIYWSLGNITIQESREAITYKNCVVRYTESSQLWTIYSYGSDIRRGATYNSGTTLTRVVGNDSGVVATQDSGTTDLGEPIKYRLRTKWYDFGSVAERKVLQELSAICEKAQGSELMYRIDEDLEWKSIAQLRQLVTPAYDLNTKFHRIKFQVTGMSRTEPPVFLGIEFQNIQPEGNIKEFQR